MGSIILVAGLSAVPDAQGRSLAGGRDREVWTIADRRLMDRFAKMLQGHGDLMALRCGNELCPDRKLKLEMDAAAEGGAVLRCGCTDRTFSRSF